jgi:hypothetical protein
MVRHFEQFEAYHQHMNLLKRRHHLIQFKKNQIDENHPISNAFNRQMLQKRATIYQEISKFTAPASHFKLSEQLIKENRRADFDDVDRPYPNLEPVIQMMEQENMKFAKALRSFNEYVSVIMNGKQLSQKFIKTNSTGLYKIAEILSSKASPIEQLYQLQQIGRAKTEKGFFYFFSHSRFFGKGRHENVEKLYQKLAHIDPEKEQDNYFAKTQLEEIAQFIQHTTSFTH